MTIIFWVLDKLLDGADWLAQRIGHQHEGYSDHFKHPFDPHDEVPHQPSLWD